MQLPLAVSIGANFRKVTDTLSAPQTIEAQTAKRRSWVYYKLTKPMLHTLWKSLQNGFYKAQVGLVSYSGPYPSLFAFPLTLPKPCQALATSSLLGRVLFAVGDDAFPVNGVAFPIGLVTFSATSMEGSTGAVSFANPNNPGPLVFA